jgi:hypothetical protein
LSLIIRKDYVKPFRQWGEQVFPDAATPAEILPKLNELHILYVQSTISGFRVPPDYPGLGRRLSGRGRESIASFQARDTMRRKSKKSA